MDQTIVHLLAEHQSGMAPDLESAEARHYLVLKIPKWKIKAVAIELAVLLVGFICVLGYNWLFKASIPPVLGVIVGAINGTLVAWCVATGDAEHEIN